MAGSTSDHPLDVISDPFERERETRPGGCGRGCGCFILLLAVVVIVGAVAYWQGCSPGFIEELAPWGDGDNGSSQQDGSDTEEGMDGPSIAPPASPARTSAPAPSTPVPPTVKATVTPAPAPQTAATAEPAETSTATPAIAARTPSPASRKEDADGDGLIEVSNLEQLNAIRYDLDGDGKADGDAEVYDAAFPADPGEVVCSQGCKGYELTQPLDFDDVDSYASGEVSATWTGGTGWAPIGINSKRFDTTFDGNGHTISNLYIDRPRSAAGLFGHTGQSSVIRATGVERVEVYGGDHTGAMIAVNRGIVSTSHSTGSVTGDDFVGGLVGLNSGPGRVLVSGPVGGSQGAIHASYASVNVSGDLNVGGLAGRMTSFATVSASYATGAVSGRSDVGGLVGISVDGIIGASYATGAVSGGETVGGLVGSTNGMIAASYSTGRVTGTRDVRGLGRSAPGAAISDCYWDTETSWWDIEVRHQGIEGKSTSELQSPTGYTGIYSNWNVDVDDADGDGNPSTGTDDFWDFGTSGQYPALRVDFDGDGTATWEEFGKQRASGPSVDGRDASANGKYDTDGDRLIEVSTLEQLNAMRYDLDGNGKRDYESGEAAYDAAFPVGETESVCEKRCGGYELVRSLDFDSTESYASGAVNDAWLTGSGWLPIGRENSRSARNRFRTTFDGNGHTISNLYISRRTGRVDPGSAGLFGLTDDASVIRGIGLVDVEVSGVDNVGGLAGQNRGSVGGAYVTGMVSGSRAVGGLVGRNTGHISHSYSSASVSGSRDVGGLAGDGGGKIFASYATGTVSGTDRVGGLIGSSGSGVISASFASGNVSGNENVGGLVGYTSYRVIASYSTGSVSGQKTVGGLVGASFGRIVTSYAAGTVSGDEHVGGLIGSASPGSANAVDNYWDIRTSGVDVGVGQGGSEGVEGKTTSDLQSPSGYTGIYRSWNVDVDDEDRDDNAATGRDDPWHFGTSRQYPVLKVDFDGDGIATWQEFGDQRVTTP